MTGLDSGASMDSTELAEIRLTRQEASQLLEVMGIRLKPATLARLWSTAGDGPPCRHIRSKPYYPRHLLEAWARSQIGDVRSGAPAAAKGRRRG